MEASERRRGGTAGYSQPVDKLWITFFGQRKKRTKKKKAFPWLDVAENEDGYSHKVKKARSLLGGGWAFT